MNIDVPGIENIKPSVFKDLLTIMLRIRIFEERVVELLYNKEIICPVHLYVGQEAIAAGVCASLSSEDYAFSTHRSHGHYIAKGGDLNRLMAELFCRSSGCSSGRGGSMHVVDTGVGFMGSSAIVAGTVPIAVGAALSAKMKGKKQVSVAFFGDGAIDEGVFYESINMAALYKLPVLFVCENNLFSTHMPIFKRQANKEIFSKVKGFGLDAIRVEGNNVAAIYLAAAEVIDRMRNGGGPFFIECMTYRWLAHVGPTPDLDIGFRKKKEVEYWMNKCPIEAVKTKMFELRYLDQETYNEIVREIKSEVEESLHFAKQSPVPEPGSLVAQSFVN